MPDDILDAIHTSIDEVTADDSSGDTAAEPDASASAEPVAAEGAVDNASVEPASDPAQVDTEDENAVTQKPAEETDEFAKEHGLKTKDKIGRENRIPYSRVKKISDNAVKKARAEWERTGAPSAELASRVQEYEQRLTKIGETERILFNEPKKFIGILRTIPGYAELLGAEGATPASKGTGIDVTAEIGPMPQPDADMGDGRKGYSSEGLTALLEWNAKRATALAVRATEERLGKRYEPIEKAFQRHQTTQQQHHAIEQQLESASNWEGFAENADAILKALQNDTALTLTLEDAYRQVVFGRLKADRSTLEADLRKKIIAELKAAPRGTSASGAAAQGAAARQSAGSGDPIADAIKESIASIR